MDLGQFALLGVTSASLHWLLARSKIAQPLWSRARGWLDALLRCPACSGFWLGLGLGAGGIRPMEFGHGPTLDIAGAGILAVFACPVAEGILIWGLKMSTVEEASPRDCPPE